MKNISKPTAFFDIETTSANVDTAQIVQISIHRLEPGKGPKILNLLVMPTCEIEESAFQVHGISKKMLEEAKAQPLSVHIPRILEMFEGADISGYNITMFDIPVLENEFYRHSYEVDLSTRNIIDVFTIVRKVYSKSLTNIYQLLTGKVRPDDAHDANADNRDTIIVLEELVKQFPGIGDSNKDWLNLVNEDNKLVDYAGKFYKKDGIYYFNINPSRGCAVDTNPDLLEWMLQKDFPRNTKLWARRLLDMIYSKPDEEKEIDDQDNNKKTSMEDLT